MRLEAIVGDHNALTWMRWVIVWLQQCLLAAFSLSEKPELDQNACVIFFKKSPNYFRP
jgi:hypothetical protein